MSSNGKRLSAREERAVEARVDASGREPQRARISSSVPRAGATTAPVPKSHRPEIKRNVAPVPDRRPASPRCRNGARKKDDATESGRKRPRENSGMNAHSNDLFGSKGMSASHLSKIIFPGAKFPHAKDMSQKDAYVDMALHCMTFLASVNKLSIDYEMTALSQGHRLTSAVKLKRVLEARVAALEADAKEAEKKRRETDGMFSESEFERKRLKQEVSSLTVRLNDASRLQDAAVQRARSELVAEYESKIGRAREKLKVLNDQPRVNIIHLAQVQSNIEFVELLQSDRAPDIGEELTALKAQEAGLSLADEEFDGHVSELEEILGSQGSNKGTPSEHASIREVIHPVSSSSSSSSDEDSSDSES